MRLIHDTKYRRYSIDDQGVPYSQSKRTGDTKKLSTFVNKDGYALTYVAGLGKVAIAHCVLNAFVGPRPDGLFACHNNGDKLDNSLSNLRWDTRSNNERDKLKHGMLKLTVEQVREVRSSSEKVGVAAKRLGVGTSTITRIRNGEMYAWA